MFTPDTIAKHVNATTGLVPLKFNRRFKNVNAGEIAGFIPETALALLNHKDDVAVLVDVNSPNAPTADNKTPAPKKAAEKSAPAK